MANQKHPSGEPNGCELGGSREDDNLVAADEGADGLRLCNQIIRLRVGDFIAPLRLDGVDECVQ